MDEKTEIKCPECGGNVFPSTTTLEYQRDGIVFVVKYVPSRMCESCGEEFIDGDVSLMVDDAVEELSTQTFGRKTEISKIKKDVTLERVVYSLAS